MTSNLLASLAFVISPLVSAFHSPLPPVAAARFRGCSRILPPTGGIEVPRLWLVFIISYRLAAIVCTACFRP